MSNVVAVQAPAAAWQTPEALPLNEAVWQAWLAKGRECERRSSLARMKAIRWGSVITLLVAAGLGGQLAPYEVMVRFVVTAGALAMMFETFHARQFAFATVFGALAALYNPIAPAFGFSGGWERSFVMASAIPVIAPLVWRNGKESGNA